MSDPVRSQAGYRERGPKRFTYTYVDLGRLLGMTPEAVRQAVCRKTLDATSLKSICLFWQERSQPTPRDI